MCGGRVCVLVGRLSTVPWLAGGKGSGGVWAVLKLVFRQAKYNYTSYESHNGLDLGRNLVLAEWVDSAVLDSSSSRSLCVTVS